MKNARCSAKVAAVVHSRCVSRGTERVECLPQSGKEPRPAGSGIRGRAPKTFGAPQSGFVPSLWWLALSHQAGHGFSAQVPNGVSHVELLRISQRYAVPPPIVCGVPIHVGVRLFGRVTIGSRSSTPSCRMFVRNTFTIGGALPRRTRRSLAIVSRDGDLARAFSSRIGISVLARRSRYRSRLTPWAAGRNRTLATSSSTAPTPSASTPVPRP